MFRATSEARTANTLPLAASAKIWAIMTLAALTGASTGCLSRDPDAEIPMAPAVREHLGELLSLAQTHSINHARIDWSSATHQVVAAARNAESIVDAENAVRRLLTLLKDGHSAMNPDFASSVPCTPGTDRLAFVHGHRSTL
jgi:hypothetical protein